MRIDFPKRLRATLDPGSMDDRMMMSKAGADRTQRERERERSEEDPVETVVKPLMHF